MGQPQGYPLNLVQEHLPQKVKGTRAPSATLWTQQVFEWRPLAQGQFQSVAKSYRDTSKSSALPYEASVWQLTFARRLQSGWCSPGAVRRLRVFLCVAVGMWNVPLGSSVWTLGPQPLVLVWKLWNLEEMSFPWRRGSLGTGLEALQSSPIHVHHSVSQPEVPCDQLPQHLAPCFLHHDRFSISSNCELK